VQMARALGCVVAGTASTPEGRALVLREGGHAALDHGAPGYLDDAVARLGGPPDLVVEMLADRNLAEDLRVVATFGRVVVVGSRGTVFLDPRAAMTKDASVLGMSLFNCPPADRAAAHAAVAAGLEAGFLRPAVGARFPLADAPAAHESLFHPGAKGKVVLVP
jgi:NADPH2:quinone reductase